MVKTQLNLSKNTNENDKANAANMRKQSVQLIIPNVTYIHIHMHICIVYMLYILSAKVQQQSALEINEGKTKQQTQNYI